MEMSHARGGVFKLHTRVRDFSAGAPLWDYLWIGEGAAHLDELREHDKNAEPYVVPCPDMSRAEVVEEDELYLHFIPYMQFPLRVDGRPMTGERAVVEGMNYRRGEDCFWTRHCRCMWQHYQEHPEGPHSYGWWDSCPGRPEARQVWLDYFDLYRPMVSERTRVWLEVTQGPLFAAPLPGARAQAAVSSEGDIDRRTESAGSAKTETPGLRCRAQAQAEAGRVAASPSHVPRAEHGGA